MKERKGFFRALWFTSFVMTWFMEALIFNFKGYIAWDYFTASVLCLYMSWRAWND